MDDQQCPQNTLFADLNLEPGEAHRLFLVAIGGDPKQYNLSGLAAKTGTNISRLWSWANGKSRWPADAWLTTMRALGAVTEDRRGNLSISSRPPKASGMP